MNEKIEAVIRDKDNLIQDIYRIDLSYRSRKLDTVFEALKGFKGGRLEITFMEEPKIETPKIPPGE